MKHKSKILFFPLLLWFSWAFAQQPNEPLQSIFNALNQYCQKQSGQKVHIHFDKSFYLNFDTIRYKAYILNAVTLQIAKNEKRLWINFADKNGKVLVQQQRRLKNGCVAGSLPLPDSLHQGVFQVIAFTETMQNADEAFYFRKKIPVFTPFPAREENTPKNPENRIKLRFFPEGGNLISGVPTRVGVKLSPPQTDFLVLDIFNSQGETVSSVDSFRFGISDFSFTPKAGEVYTALLTDNNGEPRDFDMPPVLASGFSLAVKQDPEKIYTTISPRGIRAKKAWLVLHVRGEVKHWKELKISPNKSFSVEIDKSNIPEGVAHLTLFNHLGLPESERLVFVKKPQERLKISIKANKTSYSAREKTELEIFVSDQAGNPQAATLSLSVSDSNFLPLPAFSRNQIYANLLLSSDLRGTIAQPGFYFSDHPKADEALDKLMITHGWRRFLWKDILDPEFEPAQTPPALAKGLRGRALLASGEPYSEKLVVLVAKGEKNFIRSNFTDAQGNFVFEDISLSGVNQIIIKALQKTEKSLPVHFELEKEAQKFEKLRFESEGSLPAEKQWQKVLQIAMAYSLAAIDATPDSAFTQQTKALEPFYGFCDDRYFLDEYLKLPEMIDYMRDVVRYLIVRQRGDELKIRLSYAGQRNSLLDETPLFLIDGFPTFQKDFVLNLNPEWVQRIEILGSREAIKQLGYIGQSGVCAIYSRNGNLRLPGSENCIEMEIGNQIFRREFFSPSYATTEQRNCRTPDLRPLVYWQPAIETGSNGRARVSFYNPDNTGIFNVQIQGVALSGKMFGTSLFQYHTH